MRPLALAGAVMVLAVASPVAAQHRAFQPATAEVGEAWRAAKAAFELADGLAVELVAAEPQLANPVAFHIGHDGRIYVVETHRLRAGVIDMRDHVAWIDEDLACTTVAQRVAGIRRHFGDELDDWRSASERIRCLIDDDGDGAIDRATVFADGFDDLADGIASGVLADGDEVWFTNIPKLWKLTDADRDGVAEQRAAVHHGFGVHFSLIGHDLHGLRIGPDRRLYFSIGDRGLHVEDGERTLALPHEGAVLRCELDGSGLEIVHRGLRNPQELAFGDHGDLFTGDNNSDGGDQARWVHVVDGGDSGWTIGFQWLPTRGAWNEERWWQPRHDEQPAFLVPPVRNLAHGPSGLTAYPGTGLPSRYDDMFFLCDFRGGAQHSGVLAIGLEEDGASFRIAREERFLWHVLATDVEFGIDGGLYVLDWVHGWGLTGRGRVWRSFDPELEDDAAIAETAALLKAGMRARDVEELGSLLGHADRRVRQAAQFALADRGGDGLAALQQIALRAGPRLPRLHAIWALGQLGRHGDADAVDAVVPLLDDADAEVQAQAAHVLGDAAHQPARDALIDALAAPTARLRFFAAQALGRLGDAQAVPALLDALRRNADRDAYERHAAACALARIGDRDALREAARDPSAAVRMGVLLAMRRLGDPAIAQFLDAPESALILEAARAIHDRRITAALPALAKLSERRGLDSLPLLRRVLGARRIVGSGSDARALVEFAARQDPPESMRIEALAIVAEWQHPHGQDRVLGEWRPLPQRNTLVARASLTAAMPGLCAKAPDAVVRAACDALVSLRATVAGPALAALVAQPERSAETRAGALRALAAVGDETRARAAAASVGVDAPLPLRRAARELLAVFAPTEALPILRSIARDPAATVGERRAALEGLAHSEGPRVDEALAQLVQQVETALVPAPLRLDVIEAALSRAGGPAAAAAAPWVEAAAVQDHAAWEFCEVGGDAARCERIFREGLAAQCFRCHSIGGQGGSAGPALDGIGSLRDRAYLLRAMLQPGADIADGFAQISLTKRDGSILAGVLVAEDEQRIVLVDANAEQVVVPITEVAQRAVGGSTMPPVALLLSRRDVRDLVEFLATRR